MESIAVVSFSKRVGRKSSQHHSMWLALWFPLFFMSAVVAVLESAKKNHIILKKQQHQQLWAHKHTTHINPSVCTMVKNSHFKSKKWNRPKRQQSTYFAHKTPEFLHLWQLLWLDAVKTSGSPFSFIFLYLFIHFLSLSFFLDGYICSEFSAVFFRHMIWRKIWFIHQPNQKVCCTTKGANHHTHIHTHKLKNTH